MSQQDNVAISCIVPVYNASKYLQACIESLLAQTLRNIEIILVDDGSTDSSSDICKKYLDDKRVTYYYKENGGVSSARNLGIEVAEGKYILFVDADDYIDIDLCEKTYKVAIKNNIDILLWDYYRNQDTVVYTHDIPSGEYDKEKIDKYFLPMSLAYINDKGKGAEVMWNIWMRLYKKSLLDKNGIRFDERFSSGEDMLFTLEATLAAQSLYYFKEWRPYHYVANPSSITSKYIRQYWVKRRLLIYRVYEILENNHREDLVDQANLRTFLWTIIAIKNEYKNLSENNRLEVEELIRTIISDSINQKYIDKIPIYQMDEKHQFYYKCIAKRDAKALLDDYLDTEKHSQRKRRKEKKWLRSQMSIFLDHWKHKRRIFM